MATIKIEVNNCKLDKCPFFKITKTESTDGFDRGEYWHCCKSNKEIQSFVEWHEEKKVEIPLWCEFY